ncbi:hypothetical protein NA78x_005403 [Anatilimnocola sp. NA78]|uniref:hypothetical protein n=1 Tax=Anatilimnocola sp. NA78 TaxID=3415683 RepID=UPI003CE44E88
MPPASHPPVHREAVQQTIVAATWRLWTSSGAAAVFLGLIIGTAVSPANNDPATKTVMLALLLAATASLLIGEHARRSIRRARAQLAKSPQLRRGRSRSPRKS